MSIVFTPSLSLGPGGLGNPRDPNLGTLQHLVAPLTSAGVSNALAGLKAQPANLTATIQQLKTNPKGLIAHTFTMTDLQVAALWQMDDASLEARLAPVIAHLQAGEYDGWAVTFGAVRVVPADNHPVYADAYDAAAGASTLHPNALPVGVHWRIVLSCEISG